MFAESIASSLPVKPGDVLAGKYRVERILGHGAMGAVVAAVHEQLGTRVALKFVLPEMVEDPAKIARFLREAQAAARITSEHVARVIDVGTLESGAPYIVMEYLEGSDLAALIAKRGPLPIAEAVDYVIQACAAVSEAHRIGIVHRDIKPANLFLASRGDGSSVIKVLDFGIAKAKFSNPGHGEQATLTAAGSMMGSPAYVSPEQLKSAGEVDARSDIWSMGMTLYELLSGNRAIEADTLPQLFLAIVMNPPTPLRSYCPHAPRELDAVVAQCLEKTPEKRIQSVADLVRRLAPFAPASALTLVDRIVRAGERTPAPASKQAASPNAVLREPPGHTVVDGTNQTAPSVQDSGTLPSLQAAAPEGTASAWGETMSPTTPRPRTRWTIAAGAVIAVLGAGAAGMLAFGRHGATSGAATELAAPAPSPTPVVAAANPTPVPAVSAAPAASEAPLPSASVPVQPQPLASATPVRGRAPAPVARPRKAGHVAPAQPGDDPLFDRY